MARALYDAHEPARGVGTDYQGADGAAGRPAARIDPVMSPMVPTGKACADPRGVRARTSAEVEIPIYIKGFSRPGLSSPASTEGALGVVSGAGAGIQPLPQPGLEARPS